MVHHNAVSLEEERTGQQNSAAIERRYRRPCWHSVIQALVRTLRDAVQFSLSAELVRNRRVDGRKKTTRPFPFGPTLRKKTLFQCLILLNLFHLGGIRLSVSLGHIDRDARIFRMPNVNFAFERECLSADAFCIQR